MSDNLPQRQGLLKEIFGALPPLARTILMWFLLFPLAIAISGMLLQVNVGAIIQDALKKSRGETVDIVGEMLRERIENLDDRMTSIEGSISGQGIKYFDVEKRLTLVERDVEVLLGQKRSGAAQVRTLDAEVIPQ